MAPNLITRTVQIVAPVANGAALSQAFASGNLTLNGALASAGVVTFDAARRLGIVSSGNDSAVNWTITGTDRYGRAQSEVLAGANAGTAQSLKDYLTVTKIAGSAAAAGTVQAGTTGTASSDPIVVDYFANPALYNVVGVNPNGAVYSIEAATDDLSPGYDMTANNPAWVAAPNWSAVSTIGNVQNTIQGPYTLLRLTLISGLGPVTTRFAFPLVAGNA